MMFQWDLIRIHQEVWVSLLIALNQPTCWFHGGFMRMYICHQNTEYNEKSDESRWGMKYEGVGSSHPMQALGIRFLTHSHDKVGTEPT